MALPLTSDYLDKALGKLATKDDLDKLSSTVGRLEASVTTKADIEQLSAEVHTSFSDLQSSVDRYLKRTEDWHDEHAVLKARYDLLVDLLDKKGLIKAADTHLA